MSQPLQPGVSFNFLKNISIVGPRCCALMLQLAPQHARAAAAAGAGECVRMPAGYWIIVCFF